MVVFWDVEWDEFRHENEGVRWADKRGEQRGKGKAGGTTAH